MSISSYVTTTPGRKWKFPRELLGNYPREFGASLNQNSEIALPENPLHNNSFF